MKAQQLTQRLLGGEYNVAMNLAPSTPEWLAALGASPMKLGLDLRGGIHFLMEIDMDTALTKKEQQYAEEFRSVMRDNKLDYTSSQRNQTGGIEVRFRSAEDRDAALTKLRRQYQDLQFIETQEGGLFLLKATMTEAALSEARTEAVQQNTAILRNRVNELGVAEPLIQRQGAERIVVQLPGIQDSARAKQLLSATATLEFRMVNQERSVTDALSGRVPPDSEIFQDINGNPVLLKKQVLLTGDHITGAFPGVDENGMPKATIKLDSKGGTKMTQVSRQNIGKPMASVLIEYKTDYVEVDGKLIPKPPRKVETVINQATIQSQLGSIFDITGLDSPEEARNLSILLKSGALIAPIQIVEERTIGPSLGKENIEAGLNAAVVGVGAVLAFMLVYYRTFGLVANIAVLVNIGLIVSLMSSIGAVLTLPGIAALVLTVGMAVDANVLIYERIKDELRKGTSPALAIDRGFDRAFGTIADANVTTFIAALALFGIGSGPVKGFAVTLTIGIPTTVFTALVVSRALTNLIYGGRNLKNIWI
nr:protein translocase subunit SecD [Permianibacter aggregans]